MLSGIPHVVVIVILWRTCKDLGHDRPIPSAETTVRREWNDAERTRAKARATAVLAGTPDRVHAELTDLAETHGACEIMLTALASDPADRLASYRLLVEQFTRWGPGKDRSRSVLRADRRGTLGRRVRG
ncbi:hypothetical protein N8K70_08180 [Microbacterium betulae]|uniref:Uncharacterized protein n=1 Tax=Microbacterium betulae TaxID=2981139 RepID=A0AA97I6A6_9MICO|nr:hypothetical protein [Microbacterium sp. AB]WOF24616.1 hypothetical protein N8K70_08180 [Microbacterium sp. AB]